MAPASGHQPAGAGHYFCCVHEPHRPFRQNFREIVPGKFYRSAQLEPIGFKDAIVHHGIKSVINLRGERKNELWYQNEIAVCADEKVDHFDINIGLGDLPKPETLKALVEKLEAGPYPMLMHCRSGSDRTGLGGAFYMHLVEKKPLEQAEAEQVSWHYGHFPIGRAKNINDFFELYHATAKGKNLREWLYSDYPALYDERHRAKTPARVDD